MKKLVYINPIIFIDYIRKIKASMKRTTDDANLDTENCPLFGDAKLDTKNEELIKILKIFVQYEENAEWHLLCEYDEYLKRREKLKKALLFMYAEGDLSEWTNHLNRDERLENQVKPEEALKFMGTSTYGDLIYYLET